MKKLMLLLLVSITFVSSASAELLTTANPIGQGKWEIKGAGTFDQNLGGMAAYKQSTYSGILGYGITDKIDGYLLYSNGTTSGLGLGNSNISTIGGSIKYNLFDEKKDSPFSLRTGGEYRAMSYSYPSNPSWNSSLSLIKVSLIASKKMNIFNPYGGISYIRGASAYMDNVAMLTYSLGTAVAFSEQASLMLEGELNSTLIPGGINYSSDQYSAGIAYTL